METPRRCAATTSLCMNTVHWQPRSAGAVDAAARRENSSTIATPKCSACSSRNDPVPAAQILFITKSSMCPSRTWMYFESCPPISKIVSTSGAISTAARSLAGDLVLDQVRAQQVGGQMAAAPRDRDAQHVQPLADRIADHVEPLADGLDRPAAGGQVDAFIDLPLRAEEDEVRAHRSHIHAEVGVHGPFGRHGIQRCRGARLDRESCQGRASTPLPRDHGYMVPGERGWG